MGGTGSFFSREELLGGLAPERRASTLLFAIESRTAQIVARARRALLTQVTERSVGEQERAFLAAMAGGREQRPSPSVQDLDRYATRWAELVPAGEPQLRAALGRLILAKYRVPDGARRLRAAVGMDEAAVVEAYLRLYGERPDDAFVSRLPAAERFRWLRSRIADWLERMPPFWIAFALTLTETVGGGILALPIALAGFGPVGAVALLIVFGLVNVLTIAALCEAITRNGHMRYGTAYFGRLVSDFLGRPGVIVLTVAMTPFLAVVLVMGLIGFGDVLHGATGIHPAVWAACLFAVTMFVLYRGSIDATIASAIVIGSINLVVLSLIALVAFAGSGGRADPPSAPTIGPQTLALAFGILITAYFGHLSAGNAAKVVLTRDPGGRSLILGSALAMVSVIVVYAVVVTAIFGALDERALIGYAGTVVTPLAEAAGPAIHVLGVVYATLALGLGSLHVGLSLYNLGGEALEPLADRLARSGQAVFAARPVRFAVRASPALAVFVIVEVLLLTGNASFAGPLAVAGTLAVPVLIGVFPMLLVAAARRRGDRLPQTILRLVGWRPVVVALWLIYVVGVAAHAVIWEQPIDRFLAVGATAATVVATFAVLRHGALRPAASLEVRYEPDGDAQGRASVSVVAAGRAVEFSTRSESPTDLRVELPSVPADELRLWAHRVTADEVSEGLAVQARVEGAGRAESVALGADGEATIRLAAQPVSVSFSGLPAPTATTARPPS